jgi:hypothetical protein
VSEKHISKYRAVGPLAGAMEWADEVVRLSPAQTKKLEPLFVRLQAAARNDDIGVMLAQVYDTTDGRDYLCVKLCLGPLADDLMRVTRKHRRKQSQTPSDSSGTVSICPP